MILSFSTLSIPPECCSSLFNSAQSASKVRDAPVEIGQLQPDEDSPPALTRRDFLHYAGTAIDP
jgi:hypothetical protein